MSRNRILNIGAGNPGSAGLDLVADHGFLEVAENEVRRLEPPGGDNLPWVALGLAANTATVSVRGNLLESFGAGSTVMVLASASLIFNDNHCIYDNPTAVATVPVVDLTGFPIMANGNMVRRLILPQAGVAMRINVSRDNYAVVGNLVQGSIEIKELVGTIKLSPATAVPQASNVINVCD